MPARRPFKKLPGSRESQFESLDRPALKPLPRERFEYAEWEKKRFGTDYHVEVEGHFYSVPYQLVGQELEVRVTREAVEFLHGGQRVACHVRSFERGGSTTLLDHMPRKHRHYAEWTPQRLVKWAEETGRSTSEVVETILKSRPHPHQGFHSCLGLHRLAQRYGPERLEAACRRALRIHGLSYKSIRSILERGWTVRSGPPRPRNRRRSLTPTSAARSTTRARGAMRRCRHAEASDA